MRHEKEVEEPARRIKVLDHVTCDMCGERIKREDSFDVDEVEVRRKTGSRYPDGGWGQEVAVDLCGKCFDERLVPFLRSQECQVRVEDWEY